MELNFIFISLKSIPFRQSTGFALPVKCNKNINEKYVERNSNLEGRQPLKRDDSLSCFFFTLKKLKFSFYDGTVGKKLPFHWFFLVSFSLSRFTLFPKTDWNLHFIFFYILNRQVDFLCSAAMAGIWILHASKVIFFLWIYYIFILRAIEDIANLIQTYMQIIALVVVQGTQLFIKFRLFFFFVSLRELLE